MPLRTHNANFSDNLKAGTPDPKPSGVTSSTTTVATTTTIVGPVSTISQDGSCGGTAGLTCTGATFGKYIAINFTSSFAKRDRCMLLNQWLVVSQFPN